MNDVLNANEVIQVALDDLAEREVGVYTDPVELLEALGGSYEVEAEYIWSGGFKERHLRGVNGTEAFVFSTSARVYRRKEEEE